MKAAAVRTVLPPNERVKSARWKIRRLEGHRPEAGAIYVGEGEVTGLERRLVHLGKGDLDAGMAVRVGEVAAGEDRLAQVSVGETAPHEPAVDEARALQDHRGKLGVDENAVGEAYFAQVALGEVDVRQVVAGIAAAGFQVWKVAHRFILTGPAPQEKANPRPAPLSKVKAWRRPDR